MSEKGDDEVHDQIHVLTYVSKLRKRIKIVQDLADQNENSSCKNKGLVRQKVYQKQTVLTRIEGSNFGVIS